MGNSKDSKDRWRKSEYGRTYHSWYSMVWRCNRKSGHFYKYYGSRGITVCDRWLQFDKFIKDMGYQPEGMEIDRIDNDKGYTPENCQWVSHLENTQNRRSSTFATVGDRTLTVSAWARIAGVTQHTARYHYLKGSNHFTKWIESLQVLR